MVQPKVLSAIWEGAIGLLYPPQCALCAVGVGKAGSLCPDCWKEAEFIGDACCLGCGVPVPAGIGDEGGEQGELSCDACSGVVHPWRSARAAMVYDGTGKKLVLALKHGDRADLALPLGGWLAAAVSPLVVLDMLVVPVPVHPRRLVKRRYNQAGLLATQVARRHGLRCIHNALRRLRYSPMQDDRGFSERYANQLDAVGPVSRMRRHLRGRDVLLVDDVMASGATITASTGALLDAGANSVHIGILARAMKAV